jgi:glycosyltransferase involved in cell wall biosynthesis
MAILMSHSTTIPRKPEPEDGLDPRLDDRGRSTAPAPGVRLLCAARYGNLGASSRLRLAQYRPWLERAGIRTTLRAFLSDRYVSALYSRRSRLGPVAAAYGRAFGAPAAARAHDLLWIEKEYLPWLPYWLERLAIGPAPYILDFDDAWSLRYERAGLALTRLLLGQKFPKLIRGAALTITANETLRDWALAQGAARVLLLPTVVDLEHYCAAPEPDGPFTIGWVGTPLTAAYLGAIAGPLRALAAEAKLRLLIVGAPDFRIDGVDCRHAPWDETTEAALIGQCHAGVMPLPDNAWARGKSGYKLIQYMAMARPAVASPVGANQYIVADGQTGYLATGPADWLTALRKLRDDPAGRRAMGAAARARVEAEFSLQVTAPRLIDAIRAIAGRGR